MEKNRYLILILCVSILVYIFCTFNKICEGIKLYFSTEKQNTNEYTLSQLKYIDQELNKKSVGDCTLYPTSYGWKCIDQEGRCYKIYKDKYFQAKGKEIKIEQITGTTIEQTSTSSIKIESPVIIGRTVFEK